MVVNNIKIVLLKKLYISVVATVFFLNNFIVLSSKTIWLHTQSIMSNIYQNFLQKKVLVNTNIDTNMLFIFKMFVPKKLYYLKSKDKNI